VERQDAKDARRFQEPDEELDRLVSAGERVGEGRIDLLVEDRLIVELKAIEALEPIHGVQVRSYLKATGRPLGILINFNVPVLLRGVRRVVLMR